MQGNAHLLTIAGIEPVRVDRELWDEGSMTVTQAAKHLATSRKTIFLMMNDGRLPWARLGSRRRIPRRAVLDLLVGRLGETR